MNAPVQPLVDRFSRRISYVRLSITDRCDLRCTYCMPERMTFLPRAEVLDFDEIERLSQALVARGVTKLRLTGGEPLVRRDVGVLIDRLGRLLGEGLEELTLTTNGTQLAGHADRLAAAGVKRVNVSLDTLDRERFVRLTRRDALAQVIEGIDAAIAAGLTVKLNTVALAGENEAELPDLVAWAHARGAELTFIEVMPLGAIEAERADQFLSLGGVRDRLDRLWTLTPSTHRSGGPARFYDVAETGGRIGFITPLSHNFCATCNRVRVTATGQLYMCLGDEGRVDLRSALRSNDPDGQLAEALDRAMLNKVERHNFSVAPGAAPAVARHMSVTGG